VGKVHNSDDHQDFLLAGHYLDRAVRHIWHFFRISRDGDQPVRSCCLSSIASVVVGIIFSRIAAEFILIVFRINEHLGAIRDQGQAD
jgi:hypothetical protein